MGWLCQLSRGGETYRAASRKNPELNAIWVIRVRREGEEPVANGGKLGEDPSNIGGFSAPELIGRGIFSGSVRARGEGEGEEEEGEEDEEDEENRIAAREERERTERIGRTW